MTFSHPRKMIFQKRKYNFTVMCITPRLSLNSADAEFNSKCVRNKKGRRNIAFMIEFTSRSKLLLDAVQWRLLTFEDTDI